MPFLLVFILNKYVNIDHKKEIEIKKPIEKLYIVKSENKEFSNIENISTGRITL